MYNIMIVDDEPFVRLAIKSLTDWEKENFLFKYEASNGKEALTIFNERKDIDIFIIDMNMPIMHGLELVENIKVINKNIPIIVLSAYNDYNYVRKAFKLGIIDYILKIEMNVEKILLLLEEAVVRIETEKKFENQYKIENENIFKEILLRDMLSSGCNDLSKDDLKKSGVRLFPTNIRICFVWIDDFRDIKNKYLDNSLEIFINSIKNTIDQVMSRRKCGEVILLSPEEYIIFLSFERAGQDKKRVQDVLNDIKHSLKNYLDIEVSIGVSSYSFDCNNNNLLYRESEKSARHRYIAGKNKIIFYEDIVADNIKKDNLEVTFDIRNLKNYLSDRDYKNAQNEFLRLVGLIKELKIDTVDKIYDDYLRFIFILINYLNEINEEIEDIFEANISFHEEITKFETFEEIEEWIKKISGQIFRYLNEKRSFIYSRAIVKSIKYIKNNYCNKELDLKTVSEYVELSPSYFSRLFSKETGENYTDYLTKVRISEAKRLFNETNMKVYEVCFKVGYDNVEHFSRTFKKITGISPNSYN